jgi:hypothetical protein
MSLFPTHPDFENSAEEFHLHETLSAPIKLLSPLSSLILALFGWLVASQPAVLFSHTNSASATSHQPANSIFLSQRISLSYQPPAGEAIVSHQYN